MGSLSTQISTAQQSADIEMNTFLSGLSESALGSFVGANIGTVVDSVKAAKSDRFQYLSEDLTGADNDITSTAYYLQRTQDLTQMANDIDKVAVKQVNTSVINTGLISRQEEINEWANNNKLDTLFFLQILFITLTFISSMVFLNSYGLISSYFLNLWIVLASFFAVFVLITRARYTSVLRDGRYWNKLRFGVEKDPPIKGGSKSTCPGDTPVEVVEPPPAEPTCNPNIAALGNTIPDLACGWGGDCD